MERWHSYLLSDHRRGGLQHCSLDGNVKQSFQAWTVGSQLQLVVLKNTWHIPDFTVVNLSFSRSSTWLSAPKCFKNEWQQCALRTYLYGGGTAVCVFMHILYFLLLSFNFSVKGLCDQQETVIKCTGAFAKTPITLLWHYYRWLFNKTHTHNNAHHLNESVNGGHAQSEILTGSVKTLLLIIICWRKQWKTCLLLVEVIH